MNLGEKIKQLRKSKGITQEQLSDMLNVSSQAVSKWETGATNPDLALIPDIAKLFDVSADELLGIGMNKSKSAKTENDMIYARLSRLEKMMGLLTAKDDNQALGIMLEDAKKIYSFDFTTMPDFEKSDWKIDCAELEDGKNKLVFKANPKVRVIGKTYDPMLVNDNVKIDASSVSKIFIRIKTNAGMNDGDALAKYIIQNVCGNDAEKLQKANIIYNQFGTNMSMFSQNFGSINVSPCFMNFYFITDSNPVWSEQLKFQSYYNTNELTTVCFETHHNYRWQGNVKGIRIDPVEQIPVRVELYDIVMFDNNGEIVYRYDFTQTKNFDNSDWSLSNVNQLASDNCLLLDVVQSDRTVMSYDPMILNDNIKLNVNRAKHVHIRIKTILENNLEHRGWHNNNVFYDAYLQVYFKTEYSNFYSQDKSVRVYYGSGSVVDVYADMSRNALWNGNLTGLRIDPVEGLNGSFEIELIEILEAEKTVGVGGKLASIEKRLSNIEDMMDNLEGMYSELEGRMDDLE